MYVYIYVYIHICIHKYIHTYMAKRTVRVGQFLLTNCVQAHDIYIYVYIYMCVCVCARLNKFVVWPASSCH